MRGTGAQADRNPLRPAVPCGAMARETLDLHVVLPVSAAVLYATWLSRKGHAAMTGAPAEIAPRVGAEHRAWDGYIRGSVLELTRSRRIVLAWRTSEFPARARDSRVELTLLPVPEGTELRVLHSDIPRGQSERYALGWAQFYFEPARRYFEARRADARRTGTGAARPREAAVAPTPVKSRKTRAPR